MQCLVGIDDTDSSKGSCTTYLAYRIAVDLRHILRVRAYPRLVRLNPNVPFKTRGNAAVCLPIETADAAGAFRGIASLVSKLSDVSDGANSGLVFLEHVRTGPAFEELYLRAISGLVNRHRVAKFLSERHVRTFTLGNGMGLVGAASSLAFDERFDHTYELIAYRRREFWGTARVIDSASVREMDKATFPHTFNNFDYQKRKILIAPHGPDPVFAGVRGDSPATVIGAFRTLRFAEQLDGHMVYLTNQHTDAHLSGSLDGKVYSAGMFEGTVASVAVGGGAHVYLKVRGRGRVVSCAAYEPTGDLQRAARLLGPGDLVRIHGGIRRATPRHEKIVNVEKIEVLSVNSLAARGNPSCVTCGSRMKSEGRGKGFQCRRCGRRLARLDDGHSKVDRLIVPGIYVSSPRANRHLTKPLIRYGNEVPGASQPEIEGWLDSYARPMQELVRNRR